MATNLRKRRGAQRGSVTRLETRVAELEDIANQPGTADHARQILTKLRVYEEEFKNLHFQIIDSVDEEDDVTLNAEQTVLDTFDDSVSDLTVRLEALISRVAPIAPPGHIAAVVRRLLNRKLTRVETGLNRINTRISDLEAIPEHTELIQFQEELSD